MPPPVALLGTVTIPYLGTTLPPIGVMIRYFGPQSDPSRQVTVNFAGHQVTINRVLAGNLVAAGRALERAGLAGEIRDVGGFRTSIGGSGSPIPFSMHQFGAAFDINEDGGPNGDWHTMTLDPRLVAILRRFHWFCGENWGGVSRDGGHFQFMGGTVPAGAPGGGPPVVSGPGPSHPPVVVAVVVAAMYLGALGLLVLAAAGAVAGVRRMMSREPA
jgi:D-alanyl-D-alanine carboxypeptidase